MTLLNWQYCNDLNDINEAIKTKDKDWEGLTSADDIISITYNTKILTMVATLFSG